MNIPISAVVTKVRSLDPRKQFSQSEFSYVDISALDQDFKRIRGAKSLPTSDAPSRARQLLKAGDILVSTVRPNLNAVAVVPEYLDGSIGSTGFCVLRPDPTKADASYVFQWVKSKNFIEGMVRKATGASYPAVSDRIILESLLPLPPLEEQRRIASILDQAEELRAKRRAAIALLDQLPQAIFLEMFGDPISNPLGFTSGTLSEYALQITDGEHQTPKRQAVGIKLLSARNIKDGYLDFSDVDHIGDDEYARISKRCDPKRGDILISCSGTIGRVAAVSVDERLSLVRSAALVRPKSTVIDTQFLVQLLRTPALRRRMIQRANASSQANLFQNQIRDLPTILPPINLQLSFGERIASIHGVKAAHQSALDELDALFTSLQATSFSGCKSS